MEAWQWAGPDRLKMIFQKNIMFATAFGINGRQLEDALRAFSFYTHRRRAQVTKVRRKIGANGKIPGKGGPFARAKACRAQKKKKK